MGKYGSCAVLAVKLYQDQREITPEAAWDFAVIEIFDKSQKKSDPKHFFLSLCEDGYVKGIPNGHYTNSKKNKKYASEAIRILKISPELVENKNELWIKITSNKITQNNQMDVIVTLWKDNLIQI